MLKEIGVRTNKRLEMVNITREVQAFLDAAKAKAGTVVIFVPHTTAGVTINENADPDVVHDILSFTAELVPERAEFTHAEGNSDAHIKSSMFSPSLTLIVEKGRPMLGTWQGIYFAEFDGPRSRKVWLKYVPDVPA
ncbi:MAG: secondary thiamine-phosphate synthase enzyme YjbQ [Elusimicrobia bacterium]|nr:secondary thiamine-phosphate synthase enzyme YjbQ [Elusimicrobiota bacterium]